jgi:hypothetical protein
VDRGLPRGTGPPTIALQRVSASFRKDREAMQWASLKPRAAVFLPLLAQTQTAIPKYFLAGAKGLAVVHAQTLGRSTGWNSPNPRRESTRLRQGAFHVLQDGWSSTDGVQQNTAGAMIGATLAWMMRTKHPDGRLAFCDPARTATDGLRGGRVRGGQTGAPGRRAGYRPSSRCGRAGRPVGGIEIWDTRGNVHT